MNHSQYNAAVGAASGRLLTHIALYCGEYEDAFRSYLDVLDLQKTENAKNRHYTTHWPPWWFLSLPVPR